MEHYGFLYDLLIVYAAAGLVVFAFQKMHIPAVVGLLVSGMAVGPSGLGLVGDQEDVQLLAEVGVVVLLFTIGLEFSLSRLLTLGKEMLGIGLPQVLICIIVPTLATRWYLGSWGPALFAGMLVAMSSTAVVLKLLLERGEIGTPHGKIAVAVLLLQDLLVMAFMLAIPLLAPDSGGRAGSPWGQLGLGVGVVLLILVGSRFVIPPILLRVVQTRNRELFLIFIFLFCIGMATLTAWAGLALALGAFLAGLAISESEYAHQTLAEVLPFRDTLSSLFFVSVGMLLDLQYLADHLALILATVLAMVVLKFLAAAGPSWVFGYPMRTGTLAGLSLCQIGEFSFVLAGRGLESGILGPGDYQTFLAAAVLTMALTPIFIGLGPSISGNLERLPPIRGLSERRRARLLADESSLPPESLGDHVIIAGFGLAGRNLARVLRGIDIPYVILEMNPDSVRRLRGQGEPVLYGDCARPSVLEHAGIDRAKMLVVVISDPQATRRAVKMARFLNPGLYLVARTHYAQDIDELRHLGADEVVPEDFVTSIELFDRVLVEYQVPRNLILDLIDRVRSDQYQVLRSARPVRLDMPFSVGEGAEVDSCLVPEGSPAVGRSIEALRLRTDTGATILALRRGGRDLINPDPNVEIGSGDVLVLFGDRSQVDRAIALVAPETDRPAAQDRRRSLT
ncbi:cation:proton antiporter domain-containing protein [Tautonia plasticadhaerens]|uniref:Glutathione-regulated potassium-efflux system protein KefC n=1 Tax=Tautonia plasticadhaerens TaxID=2527974 RepID=A0A518GXV6_9BACT|nr:cation:proton antiporter [Tautonia plasticadhaerens]QDV33420.1 Glutathione-regulated potassium-efflux system protein KefC [Tautonia plasticadhaerens]